MVDQFENPNPDPTVATTDAVERAVAALRDFVIGQVSILEERLNGIDKATSVDASSMLPTPNPRRRAANKLSDNTSKPSPAARWRCNCSRQALLTSTARS